MYYEHKIGEVLVQHDAMTQEQVHRILVRQECGDTRRFGDIAVHLHYIDRDTLESSFATASTPLWQNKAIQAEYRSELPGRPVSLQSVNFDRDPSLHQSHMKHVAGDERHSISSIGKVSLDLD